MALTEAWPGLIWRILQGHRKNLPTRRQQGQPEYGLLLALCLLGSSSHKNASRSTGELASCPPRLWLGARACFGDHPELGGEPVAWEGGLLGSY